MAAGRSSSFQRGAAASPHTTRRLGRQNPLLLPTKSKTLSVVPVEFAKRMRCRGMNASASDVAHVTCNGLGHLRSHIHSMNLFGVRSGLCEYLVSGLALHDCVAVESCITTTELLHRCLPLGCWWTQHAPATGPKKFLRRPVRNWWTGSKGCANPRPVETGRLRVECPPILDRVAIDCGEPYDPAMQPVALDRLDELQG